MFLQGAGYGYLVFAIVFVDSLIAELVSEYIVKNDEYYQDNLVPLALSLIVSGSIIQAMENHFRRKWEDGEVVKFFSKTMDPAASSFFFIPVKYWPRILWVLGLGLIAWHYYPRLRS